MIRVLMCIFAFGCLLYSTLDQQNELTKLSLRFPELMKEVKTIRAENMRLQYQIDQFESPAHLLQLASLPQFSHLKHPLVSDILTCAEGPLLELPGKEEGLLQRGPRLTLAIGAKY